MNRLLLLLALILLGVATFVTSPRAAYNTAVVDAVYLSASDGSLQVTVRCVGTAGDPDATKAFTIQGSVASVVDLRAQTWAFCDGVGRTRNLFSSITAGANLAKPANPAAPTAEQLWRLDYARWLRVQVAIEAGILTGAETEVVALKNSVKTGYTSAYLANF